MPTICPKKVKSIHYIHHLVWSVMILIILCQYNGLSLTQESDPNAYSLIRPYQAPEDLPAKVIIMFLLNVVQMHNLLLDFFRRKCRVQYMTMLGAWSMMVKSS